MIGAALCIEQKLMIGPATRCKRIVLAGARRHADQTEEHALRFRHEPPVTEKTMPRPNIMMSWQGSTIHLPSLGPKAYCKQPTVKVCQHTPLLSPCLIKNTLYFQ